MSIISDALTNGFDALLQFGSEALTTNGVSVEGLVNRKLSKIRDSVSTLGGEKPDFSVLGFTELELMKRDVAQPVAGDSFLDARGWRHRVRYVVHTDITWVCYCQPSQVMTRGNILGVGGEDVIGVGGENVKEV